MIRLLVALATSLLLSTSTWAWSIDVPGVGRWKGDDPQVVKDISVGVRESPERLFLNPMGFINHTGIPTSGDVFEFVVEDPERTIELVGNPDQWPYLPVASAIIAGRNAVMSAGTDEMPQDMQHAVGRFFPFVLMDSVRWTTDWNLIKNMPQAVQMFANRDTRAITLINAIVFRTEADARDPTLWAHELFHVQQYRAWGVFGFAKRWTDNSSVSGPVEGPAYEVERTVRSILTGNTQTCSSNPQLGPPLSPGMCWCAISGTSPQAFCPTRAQSGPCDCNGARGFVYVR